MTTPVPSRQPRAFTLIELLVVITIIAILLALLTPTLDKAMLLTDVARCGANLHAQYLGVYQYAAAQRGQLPPLNNVNKHNQGTGLSSRVFRQKYQDRGAFIDLTCNLGYVWEGGYLAAGAVFFCPAQHNPMFTYAHHADPTFPTYDTSKPEDLGGQAGGVVRASYNFNPVATSLSDRNHKYRKFSQLDGQAVLAVDLIEWQPDTVIAHIELGGFNVSHGAGSVDFARDEQAVDLIDANHNVAGSGAADYLIWDTILDRIAHPGR